MKLATVMCLAMFLSSMFLLASEPLHSLQVTQPPTLDGVLDEEIWQKAPFMTDYMTFTPSFGQPMAQKTKAYFAHDHENLYFAFRCYDTEPDKIKASLSKRDQINRDDWICINLDSFNDQQALYGLYVNPLGIQGDTRFANNNEDDDFDMVWYSAGRIDGEGYTVEVRVPLKSIRFSGSQRVEMGVIFERRISRLSEQGTAPPLAPAQGMSFLTQMQTLVFNDLHRDQIFELLPAVTYNHRQARQDGELRDTDKGEELSLTAKYGITSQLILDATYNPDFNQVEADAGQVDINLRSALFFGEKRPFFQEGSESFNFAANAPGNPIQAVVHTRNIVDPEWGIKLNGKLSRKDNLAVLLARDEVDETDPADFGILRYKHQFTGDNYAGGIYTARKDDHVDNRIIGLDGLYRLTPASTFEYYGLASQTDAFGVDSDGSALALVYAQSTREREFSFGANHVSEDFRLDSGYVGRTGLSRFTLRYNPRWYPKIDGIQRIIAELYSSQTRDEFSGIWETFNELLGQIQFLKTKSFRAKYRYSSEVFLGQEFSTNGFSLQWSDRPNKQFNYLVYYSEIDSIFFSANPYQGFRHFAQAELEWQPDQRWNAKLNYQFSDFFREADNSKVYQYPLTRLRTTFQANKYLFVRAIGEYNGFRRELLTDFLVSFTYIPGTVMHLGYGSLFERRDQSSDPADSRNDFIEATRGLFFKASYLWRK